MGPSKGSRHLYSGTDITGRPGDRTMEMIGRSTALHLACTPYIPMFLLVLIGLEAEGLLDRWNPHPVVLSVDLRFMHLAHRNRSDFCDLLCNWDAHRRA